MKRVSRWWLVSLALVAGLMMAAAALVGAQDEPATPAALATGAVYMALTNTGDTADRLVGATTDVAAAVEIHETHDDDGIMRMRPLPDGLEVPAGETVVLEPGGLHLMLIGLTHDLEPDASFTITLDFEIAGPIDVPVTVYAGQSAAAAATPAPPVTAGTIEITGAWARQAAGGGHDHGAAAGGQHGTPEAGGEMQQAQTHGSSTGVVYMTIENQGDAPDRLIAAATDAAEIVEIHQVIDDDGVMRMRPLADGLEIAPGETVSLESGGYHLMLIGLTESLLTDQTFTVTLTFEEAGEVTVEALVGAGNDKPESFAAEPVTAGGIVVSEVWSRPAPKLD